MKSKLEETVLNWKEFAKDKPNLKGPFVPMERLVDICRYSAQYVDYSKNQWTMPCVFTSERAARLLKDSSVTRIKFIPLKEEEQGFYLDVSFIK